MVDAGEFNDWYDTEHLPERQRCKGFINAVRWLAWTIPRWRSRPTISRSHAVLHSAPYLAIGRENLSPWSKRMVGKLQRLLRIEADQLVPGDEVARNNTPNLMMFACNVKPDMQAEVRKWYRRGTYSASGKSAGRGERAVFWLTRGHAQSHRALRNRQRRRPARRTRGKKRRLPRGPSACDRT